MILFNENIIALHLYKEQPDDTVFKQRYPDGTLHWYTVLKDGKSANGWSRKKYYPNAALLQEENYSNGLLIEKISYDESGAIASHKIWNHRLKQLVDKTVQAKLFRPNVVTGHGSLTTFLNVLPAVAIFIDAQFEKASLLKLYEKFLKTDEEDQNWQLKGLAMNFTIYWLQGEMVYRWHSHCYNEDQYWKARLFFKNLFQ